MEQNTSNSSEKKKLNEGKPEVIEEIKIYGNNSYNYLIAYLKYMHILLLAFFPILVVQGCKNFFKLYFSGLGALCIMSPIISFIKPNLVLIIILSIICTLNIKLGLFLSKKEGLILASLDFILTIIQTFAIIIVLSYLLIMKIIKFVFKKEKKSDENKEDNRTKN